MCINMFVYIRVCAYSLIYNCVSPVVYLGAVYVKSYLKDYVCLYICANTFVCIFIEAHLCILCKCAHVDIYRYMYMYVSLGSYGISRVR